MRMSPSKMPIPSTTVRRKGSDRHRRRLGSRRGDRQAIAAQGRQRRAVGHQPGRRRAGGREIEQGQAVVSARLPQDTAKPEDSEKVVEARRETYGALHYAVNNAGIGGAQAPAGETDLEDWDRVIDINLNGVCTACATRSRPCWRRGRACAIVNMASIHGTVAAIGNGAYTAAKHGVVGLTKNAAAEYGPQGLRINCVGPAYIETPLLAGLPAEFREAARRPHPLGRLGQPEEVAPLVASSCPTRRRSSRAATTSSTAATRPSDAARAPRGHVARQHADGDHQQRHRREDERVHGFARRTAARRASAWRRGPRRRRSRRRSARRASPATRPGAAPRRRGAERHAHADLARALRRPRRTARRRGPTSPGRAPARTRRRA
jgi:NAD(P)-dependent dehydrogenase (short-subunit alcohol dehydrogenase family)